MAKRKAAGKLGNEKKPKKPKADGSPESGELEGSPEAAEPEGSAESEDSEENEPLQVQPSPWAAVKSGAFSGFGMSALYGIYQFWAFFASDPKVKNGVIGTALSELAKVPGKYWAMLKSPQVWAVLNPVAPLGLPIVPLVFGGGAVLLIGSSWTSGIYNWLKTIYQEPEKFILQKGPFFSAVIVPTAVLITANVSGVPAAGVALLGVIAGAISQPVFAFAVGQLKLEKMMQKRQRDFAGANKIDVAKKAYENAVAAKEQAKLVLKTAKAEEKALAQTAVDKARAKVKVKDAEWDYAEAYDVADIAEFEAKWAEAEAKKNPASQAHDKAEKKARKEANLKKAEAKVVEKTIGVVVAKNKSKDAGSELVKAEAQKTANPGAAAQIQAAKKAKERADLKKAEFKAAEAEVEVAKAEVKVIKHPTSGAANLKNAKENLDKKKADVKAAKPKADPKAPGKAIVPASKKSKKSADLAVSSSQVVKDDGKAKTKPKRKR